MVTGVILSQVHRVENRKNIGYEWVRDLAGENFSLGIDQLHFFLLIVELAVCSCAYGFMSSVV